ncbi:MAG: hypothetical protein KME25_07770 [Symplocastrum torsivum CPER-KK1]|uniref:Uncharacterized protein n=1 Tax=Symplocastrum torsivum CPER-KK1 TaxID=450513 RepID=A0A951PIK6_9CYAN|nr:hypothetical protein [Symplocastrum torsivum CPER-KK1]
MALISFCRPSLAVDALLHRLSRYSIATIRTFPFSNQTLTLATVSFLTFLNWRTQTLEDSSRHKC